MKLVRILAAAFLCLLVFSGCDQNTANVTIPAGEEFVLGEQAADDYSANLENTGIVEIKVAVRSKSTGQQTQGFGLNPGGKVDVNISKEETVFLINASAEDATVFATLSKPVEGMRYQAAGAKS
jgi:hypothetical protein